MTTERPYRARLPARGACEELRRCAGTQFDPAVVEAFLAEIECAGERASSPLPRTLPPTCARCSPAPERSAALGQAPMAGARTLTG